MNIQEYYEAQLEAQRAQTEAIRDLADAIRGLTSLKGAPAAAEPCEASMDNRPEVTAESKQVEAVKGEEPAASESVSVIAQVEAEERVYDAPAQVEAEERDDDAPAHAEVEEVAVDRDFAMDLCASVAEKLGPQAVMGAISSFGYNKLSKIPDKEIPEFCQKLERILKTYREG